MKLEVLPIGAVPAEVAQCIHERIALVFPHLTCHIADATLPLPERALDEKRGQYSSSLILNEVQRYAVKRGSGCVLGVVDADIFVSGLNFVFGEAAYPGKAALISLWRLRPEFYHQLSNTEVFLERAVKEAVHEVGHMLGLGHCPHSLCVMHFSNSILDTDNKQSRFCARCAEVAARLLHVDGC